MSKLLEKIRSGRCAMELFFARPGTGGTLEYADTPALRLLAGALNCAETAASGATVPPGGAGLTHYLNFIVREVGGAEFLPWLYGEVFDVFIACGVLPDDLAAAKWSDNTDFLLKSFSSLLEAVSELRSALDFAERRLLMPETSAIFDGLPDFGAAEEASDADLRKLAVELVACDRFGRDRVFRFADGKFLAVHPDSAKPTDKFFGFPSVRAKFADHFNAFGTGKSNLPLLIYSLPGYGKTSMTVSYALSLPGAVLILAEPELLEHGWRQLMETLKRRTDRKFVVFFDDIDPRAVDWYNFRTNVGGAFSLPPNVMPVLSSNYEFPAGILSRGRKLSYPVFDELRCTEMIEDFLRNFGLKKTPRNLVFLMGADYTEEFGQKKFSELSPRTLMRYLSTYEYDLQKRRTIAEMSLGEMVARPDGELFYEFNIELMRSLYGEEYIQRLLKEKLRVMENK